MRSLFGRHFWILRLFGVAAASGLAGSAASSALALMIVQGATSVLEGAEVDDEDPDLADDEPEALASTTNTKPRARGSVGRQAAAASLSGYNPFCPSCQPPTLAPEMLAQGPSAPGTPGIATVATRLPLRLHATMEAVVPGASLATIYDLEHGVVGVYGEGDTIRAGVTVSSVTQGRVSLKTPTGFELLELGAPPPPVEATPKVKPDEEPKAKPESSDLDAIQCSTDDNCVVERAFVDEILANPAKFASQAPRIIPMPDGGFKVSGVRKGSLAKKLGLVNGDVLLAVNGQEIRGLDDALGLMTKLRRASNLEVTLDRKGKSVRKQIEIK